MAGPGTNKDKSGGKDLGKQAAAAKTDGNYRGAGATAAGPTSSHTESKGPALDPGKSLAAAGDGQGFRAGSEKAGPNASGGDVAKSTPFVPE